LASISTTTAYHHFIPSTFDGPRSWLSNKPLHAVFHPAVLPLSPHLSPHHPLVGIHPLLHGSPTDFHSATRVRFPLSVAFGRAQDRDNRITRRCAIIPSCHPSSSHIIPQLPTLISPWFLGRFGRFQYHWVHPSKPFPSTPFPHNRGAASESCCHRIPFVLPPVIPPAFGSVETFSCLPLVSQQPDIIAEVKHSVRL